MIPADWSRHHARHTPTAMNATLVLAEPVAAPGNPFETEGEQSYAAIWSGAARVQAILSPEENAAGGQRLAGRAYLVQLPFEAPPARPGHRITAQGDNDPALADLGPLWVIEVPRGSERFTRDLFCSDNQDDLPAAVAP